MVKRARVVAVLVAVLAAMVILTGVGAVQERNLEVPYDPDTAWSNISITAVMERPGSDVTDVLYYRRNDQGHWRKDIEKGSGVTESTRFDGTSLHYVGLGDTVSRPEDSQVESGPEFLHPHRVKLLVYLLLPKGVLTLKGTEEVLGRTSHVLRAKDGREVYWVDVNDGIVLKYEAYNEPDQEPAFRWEVKEIYRSTHSAEIFGAP